MRLSTVLLTAAAASLTLSATAQKLKLESGSFAAAKAEKEFNIVYDYSDFNVGTGKRAKKESDYVAEKVAEFNQKEAGRGDNWKESWLRDREARFQPKFEELMAKGGLKKNSGAKYTLTVKTTMLEPGFSVPMVMTVPAALDCKVILSEGGKELGVMSITGSPGNAFGGAAWDTGIRLQETYAKAGKELAKWIPKAK